MSQTVGHWHEVSREVVFSRYGRSVEQVDFVMPTGDRQAYFIKAERPTVCVLALTPERNVLLARQFRPGPMKVLYELPGGFADAEEDVESVMGRELLEETGHAGTLKKVATCLDDAYSTVVRHCFVATDCRPVQEPRPGANEHILIECVDLARFRALLRSGQMTDVEAGYLGLDYLGLL